MITSRTRRHYLYSASLMCFLLLPIAAQADTFADALRATYENNPKIKAQRQSLQAVDEAVSQANAGFLPTANGTWDYGRQRSDFASAGWNYNNANTKQLRVEQPLFKGGSTVAKVNSARQRVKAGQEQLDAIEQNVLLDAITSYMDVVQAQAILELSRNNQDVLARQLTATQQRFEAGDVTRTDLAQSEARLSASKSAVISAQGQLTAALATFARVIGYAPSTALDVPQAYPPIPESLKEALLLAKNSNPGLLSAIHAQKSASYDVSANEGALLPQISLVGSASRSDSAGVNGNAQFNQDSVVLNMRIPLYQGGAEYSRVREAKARERQRRDETANNLVTVEESTTQAWQELETSIATITSREDQIKASQIALDGVRKEQEYGARTVLDVLDAEQELFSARTNLVRAQRDRIVAVYKLLNTLGRLTPENLHVGTSYDPNLNYDDVKWQIIGF
jgi:outer membrane protein